MEVEITEEQAEGLCQAEINRHWPGQRAKDWLLAALHGYPAEIRPHVFVDRRPGKWVLVLK